MRRSALLYDAVRACEGVLKDAKGGGAEGEEDEGDSEQAKGCEGKLGAVAGRCVFEKPFRFKEVGDGCREEEDRDVDPIGGFADHTVIGIESGRNDGKAEQDAL